MIELGLKIELGFDFIFKSKSSLNPLQMATLSESDQRILESIFNPNQTFGYEIQSDEIQATGERIENGHEETEAERKARELEMSAVKNAEEGNIDIALNCLNEALTWSPNSASVYNNRAQVLLLKGMYNRSRIRVYYGSE